MVPDSEVIQSPSSSGAGGESAAVRITREAIRRWPAGDPMGDLFAPDYAVVGTPVPFQAISGITPDERRREIRSAMDIRFRDVTPGAPGRALFEAVWVHHRQGGGGSSGLYWGVVTIDEHELISRLAYLHDRAEARAAAGLD